MSLLREIGESLASLCFPPRCLCCGEPLVAGESLMCLNCRLDFPLTGFETAPDFNPLMERLICKAPITRATAYFHYERLSPYARLIHAAKYYGKPSVGAKLAQEYALKLMPGGFFDGIDAIVPIPLSLGKLIKRGYNQSYHVALGISRATSIPIVDALKAKHHKTQTRKNAYERTLNAQGIYGVRPGTLDGLRHILLVDDIATTGATLTACAEAAHSVAPCAEISIFTLASTRLG